MDDTTEGHQGGRGADVPSYETGNGTRTDGYGEEVRRYPPTNRGDRPRTPGKGVRYPNGPEGNDGR